jgi:uncharacterized SAM-binding protein YcdF (DUF218 family)
LLVTRELTQNELVDLCVSIDKPEPVDLAIVLGCTEPGDDPDFPLRNRVQQCNELLQGRYFCRVLLTGGAPADIDRGARLSEAERMQEFLRRLHPQEIEILLEREACNTCENAHRSAAILAQQAPDLLQSLTSIIVITCDYHTRRARHEFKQAFPQCRVLCSGFINEPTFRLEKCQRELIRLKRLGLIETT